MQKWEYKTGTGDYPYPNESALNRHGEEGWELAAAAYNSNRGELTFIFKRPKN